MRFSLGSQVTKTSGCSSGISLLSMKDEQSVIGKRGCLHIPIKYWPLFQDSWSVQSRSQSVWATLAPRVRCIGSFIVFFSLAIFQISLARNQWNLTLRSLCSKDPLNSFFIGKGGGVTGVYVISLMFAQNINYAAWNNLNERVLLSTNNLCLDYR